MAFIKRSQISGNNFEKLSQRELDELEKENNNKRGNQQNECTGDSCQCETDTTDRGQQRP